MKRHASSRNAILAAAPLREVMSRQGLAELRMEPAAFSENLKDSALQALAAARPDAEARGARPKRAPEAPAPKGRSTAAGDRQ